MWPMLALAGGSALLGMDQARQQQKQQKAQNMAAATQTEFSPWTGMGQGQMQSGAPSTLAAGLQGGLTGFMQGKNIEAGMAKPEVPSTQTTSDLFGSPDQGMMAKKKTTMYG